VSAEFVAACRREWKRLGVPLHVAVEMADELRADLDEAAADGVPADELVGGDPRAFAASWAAARGVVPARRAWFRPTLFAFATVAAAGLAIAGTVLLATRSTSRSATPSTSTITLTSLPTTASVTFTATKVAGSVVSVNPRNGSVSGISSAPAEWFDGPAATTGSGSRTPALVLLSVGLAFLILLSLAAPRLGRPPARPAGP